MKNKMEAPAEKFITNEVLEKLWTHLIVDFITKLPLVVEKDTILVVCNKLSKIAYFVAITEGILVERLARLFRDNVWKLHRLLSSVILDKGPQFAAELVKELNRMLGIEIRLSTAFHPQMNGQMEQMNQELEQYLRFFIEYKQRDWLEWLVTAEFAVNNKVHIVTNVLLFMTNYERELRIEADIRRKEKVEKATEFAERMRKVQEKAGAALRKV